MGYTVTAKMVNIEDWSEYDVRHWTQDVVKNKIVKPNAVDPKYLLIYTSNEVIVFNKNGEVVLQKTFDFTVDKVRINNNGDFIIKSGSTIYIYDINGNLLYQNTYATSICEIDIGLNYVWVSLSNNPRDIFVIDLSVFSVVIYNISLIGNYYYPLRCSENGDKAVTTDGKASEPGSIIFITKDGSTKKINLGVDGKPDILRVRPDGGFAFVASLQAFGPVRIFAGRFDGAKALLGSVSKDAQAAIAISVNGDKIAFIADGELTIYKKLLNIETMEVSDAGTVGVPEPIDSVTSPDACLDMTPDGNYIVIPSGSKIRIIEWETNIIKKEVTKNITYSYYAVLSVEVT